MVKAMTTTQATRKLAWPHRVPATGEASILGSWSWEAAGWCTDRPGDRCLPSGAIASHSHSPGRRLSIAPAVSGGRVGLRRGAALPECARQKQPADHRVVFPGAQVSERSRGTFTPGILAPCAELAVQRSPCVPAGGAGACCRAELAAQALACDCRRGPACALLEKRPSVHRGAGWPRCPTASRRRVPRAWAGQV